MQLHLWLISFLDKLLNVIISFAYMQANAEPDLQQTGDRLKPVVEGLVEGIMHLVVDPLAHSQVNPPPPPQPCPLAPLRLLLDCSRAGDLC